jgi:hypothetical protein
MKSGCELILAKVIGKESTGCQLCTKQSDAKEYTCRDRKYRSKSK